MEQVIQFRSTIDTFSAQEYQSFRSKLFAVYDERSLLTKLLFLMLMNQAKHANYADTERINGICKEITDLRRKKQSTSKPKEDQQQPDTNYFNALPSAIISNTASYLETSEQPKFMNCNRYIFISCMSTPSTIQKLPCSKWINAYLSNYGVRLESSQLSKLDRFRMAKSVSLPFSYQHDVAWIGQPLDRLTISDLRPRQPLVKHWVKILPNVQIKELCFDPIRFDTFHIQQEMECVSNLIAATSNIEFLGIRRIVCPGTFNLFGHGSMTSYNCDKIAPSLRNLRGLSLTSMPIGDFPDKLLQSVSYKMKSLHLSRNPSRTLFQQDASMSFPLCSHENVRYGALEELRLCELEYPLISNIFASATGLKRIHWVIGRHEMEYAEIKNLMQCIFGRLVDLKYLCIHPLGHVAVIAVRYLIQAMRGSKVSGENFRLRIVL